MEGKTIRLKAPFGRALLLGTLVLLAVMALLEWAARTDGVRELMPAPSMGIGHRFLDLKLEYMSRLAENEGPIECVFLGTSQMAVALNPEEFSTSFEQVSGRPIRSFNFGIAGISLPSYRQLMDILLADYQPRLLVVGIFPPNFSADEKEGAQSRIRASRWLHYRLGRFNLEGWLIEHLKLFRYILRFRQWLEQPDLHAMVSTSESRLSPYGFSNFKNRNNTRSLVPDPKRLRRFKRMLADFTVADSRLDELEHLMTRNARTNLVFVEMPVHPLFRSLYGGGEKDHYLTMEIVAERVRSRGIPFIEADRPEFDKDEMWLQTNHMNARGAEFFSRWLGRKIGRLVIEQRTPSPAGVPE
jgi:hypothetical protein